MDRSAQDREITGEKKDLVNKRDSRIDDDTPPARTLPANIAAERSVLGGVIEDDGLLPEVIAADLQREDFSLSDHQRVFSAILSLHERKLPVDYVTVAEELGNDQNAYVLLGSLIQGVIVHEDHILHHVAIVRKKSRLRALLRLAEWLTKAVTESADPDKLIIATREKLEAL
jgi:replicative DNA helicase